MTSSVRRSSSSVDIHSPRGKVDIDSTRQNRNRKKRVREGCYVSTSSSSSFEVHKKLGVLERRLPLEERHLACRLGYKRNSASSLDPGPAQNTRGVTPKPTKVWNRIRMTKKAKTHLLLNVIQRIGRVDREADEDDVRVGVRERAEAVVVCGWGGLVLG